MGNSKQALPYQRPSSIRDHESWPALGYAAAALLALALVLAMSQGPAVPDPGFASAAVLP
jgi:hypothetical protein